MITIRSRALALASLLGPLPLLAADWPEWGGDPSKNMIAEGPALPVEFAAGEEDDEGLIDFATTENCRWVARLGSESYGTPTIANGRVLVGTNNERPRNPKIIGDRGVVMCFSEKTGEFQWQMTVPKLPGGEAVDWEFLGICSSTLQDGDFGYVITNRCEVACLDLKGLADGNDGFSGEGQYMAGPGADPVAAGPTDADIVWVYDMRKEVGVEPHNITSSSPALVAGRVFATTSNGEDVEHAKMPAPDVPCLIALDAKTGKLAAREASGIGARTFHCNWSSPAVGKSTGKDAVYFGAGDGFLYAFDATAAEEGKLRELWRYDANPEEYRVDEEGQERDYPSYKGPSEIVGTPVFAGGRVYVAIGQDPEHGDGLGMLSCVDADTGKPVWTYQGVTRSLSTPAVSDGLVYLSDFSGQIHCLDAESGEEVWKHDTLSRIWGSTLVADGKVYLGTEDGELIILKAGRTLEELGIVEFPGPIFSSPVAANGTLYVQTQSHLFAFAKEQ